MTIREAAALLAVHPNTIKNRLRKGMYTAEKVLTEHGETWMIDRNSLSTKTPSTATQTSIVQVPDEAIQELARAIVRDVGIAQDPVQTKLLEKDKASVELFKALLFLNTALLTGVGVLVSIAPNPLHHLGTIRGTVVFAIVSIALALCGLVAAIASVGTEQKPRASLRDFPFIDARMLRWGAALWAVVMFLLGLAYLMLFVWHNLPVLRP